MKKNWLVLVALAVLAVSASARININLDGGGEIAPLIVGDTSQTMSYGGWVRLGLEFKKISLGVQTTFDMNYFNGYGQSRGYVNDALGSPTDVSISRLYFGPYAKKNIWGPIYGTATVGATIWWMSELTPFGGPVYAQEQGAWTDLMGTLPTVGIGAEANIPLFWRLYAIGGTELKWTFGADDFTVANLGGGGQLRAYLGLGIYFPLGKEKILEKITEPPGKVSAKPETLTVVKNVPGVPKDLTSDGMDAYASLLIRAADSLRAIRKPGSMLTGTILAEPLALSGFKTDSSNITGTMHNQLKTILPLLQKNPDVYIAITGYTDSQGSCWRNVALSYDRAKAVEDWLVSHGVNYQRITVAGEGWKNPIVPNDTPENMSRNRRAKLTFYMPFKTP